MRICGKRNTALPKGYGSAGFCWVATDWLKQCFLPYGHSGPHVWGRQP